MRYIVLVLINIPIIFLALINLVTNHKTNKTSRRRFKYQIITWLIILVILIGSFPLYNYIIGRPILNSSELSLFDMAEVTVIIYLIYAVNNQRRKIEQNEKSVQQLHREVAIKLSEKHE